MTGRDNKERVDATVNPPAAEARADVSTPAIWHRLYFSSYLLWTAQHEAELAGQIEAAHVGSSRFSIEHRAHVLSSTVASVGFLEAMANELYQDAVDGHSADAYVTPLPAESRQAMVDFWRASGSGRSVETIEKYERLLEFAGAVPLDRGGQLYEDARLVITVRNIIVHYLPENLSAAAEAHDMERRFRTKNFAENALMVDSGNPWWPDKALGYGCASWAHRSMKALADYTSDAIGIVPNYCRHWNQRDPDTGAWLGQVPGTRELDNAR
jgi:hypothetical protein